MTSVTVIIPVFNRADRVGRAIDSVLSQEVDTGTTLEVLVVDDGSQDALGAVLSRYEDKIACIRHETNCGAANARNSGIAAARGEYVALLDSDDTWFSGKIATQLAEMRQRGWEASCTAYLLHKPSGKEWVSPHYSTRVLALSNVAWGCFVSPGSTLMCRRAIFEAIGPFDTSLRRLEDWDWLLRFSSVHNLGFIDKPLARIEISQHRNAAPVLEALETIRTKHVHALSDGDQKRLLAAIDLERAAAFLRSGRTLAAVRSALCSLLRQPLGNAAFGAVVFNKIAISRRPS